MSPEMGKLCAALKEWNIDIDNSKLEKFEQYMDLLLEWNKNEFNSYNRSRTNSYRAFYGLYLL